VKISQDGRTILELTKDNKIKQYLRKKLHGPISQNDGKTNNKKSKSSSTTNPTTMKSIKGKSSKKQKP
jgi:hypothetical protein